MSDLLRRKRATEATLAKYRSAAFNWRGGVTCVHMARFHLRKMGHAPESLPRLRSALAARRALNERGWKDVGAMLDSMLPRIAPAAILLGDLVAADSADGFGSILICAGPHKLLGWHEDAPGMVVIDTDLSAATGAWRA